MPNIDVRSFVSSGRETDPTGIYRWQSRFPYGGTSGVGPRKTATAAASEAGKFNIGQASNIKNISDVINEINRTAQTAALRARIPGAAGLEKQSSELIRQELAGGVPTDVQNLLAQQAAERGIGGVGAGTGQNVNAAYLRALGLTSLGQEQAGQQNLSAAYARNPAAAIFDPSSMLLTPSQSAQLELGYQSEADRVALERERLAAEAARGGRGGGGGGYGYGGPDYGASPYQYAEPGTYAYGPAGGGTTTGGTVRTNVPFDWASSIRPYTPAGSTPGTFFAGSPEDYYSYVGGG